MQKKLRLLEAAVSGILAFHCPCWPFTPGLARRLDHMQCSMVGKLLHRPFRPLETAGAYFSRVHREAARVISSGRRWVDLWASRLRSWRGHVQRHPRCWSFPILRHRDEAWLRGRRTMHLSGSWGILAGRTDTRVARGYVHRRWEASFADLPPAA